MLAMTLTAPPHLLQALKSMLHTRLSRCAQVMDTRRSAGVWLSADSGFSAPHRLRHQRPILAVVA